MCEKEENKREDKSSRTETEVYINGERYIQVIIKDYSGDVVFTNLYKQ